MRREHGARGQTQATKVTLPASGPTSKAKKERVGAQPHGCRWTAVRLQIGYVSSIGFRRRALFQLEGQVIYVPVPSKDNQVGSNLLSSVTRDSLARVKLRQSLRPRRRTVPLEIELSQR